MYGIYTYIYHKNQPNVGIYPSPMDPMGVGKYTTRPMVFRRISSTDSLRTAVGGSIQVGFEKTYLWNAGGMVQMVTFKKEISGKL